MNPSKGRDIYLSILVALRRGASSNQRVSKDGMGKAVVTQHPIICEVSAGLQRVKADTNALLGGMVHSHAHPVR